jgi:arylsulfatase A-like enzyme
MMAPAGSARPEVTMRRLRSPVLSLLSLLPSSALLVVGTSCTAPDTSEPAPGRRPNLVYIMADDLGWADLGSYGQAHIETPRLDRMAAEGTRFTQYYAGSTVCAPSRATLMTGQHTGHAWIRGNGEFPLRPEDVTVAEVLKEAGYATGVVGKWGLGVEDTEGRPGLQGFDFSYGILHHVYAHRQYAGHLWKNGEPVEVSRDDFVNDLFTDEALSFIRRNHETPFFLYLAYTSPHAELRVPEDSVAGYRGRFEETPYVNEDADADWPRAEPRKWSGYRSQPEPRATYAGMVSRIDRDVGRILDLLAELGLDDDTLVFFTSDNGPHKEGGHDPFFFPSAKPLRGFKRDLYEGGIRVPMIVRAPGRVPAGRTSDAAWAHWDVLLTFADLAGAVAPSGLDGVSRRAALESTSAPASAESAPLYWEFHERGFEQAVRLGKWKAVRHGTEEPLELYDLEADLSETTDVADWNPEVVAKFEAYLKTARTESPLWPVEETSR